MFLTTSPNQISFLDTNYAQDISIVGNYAYIADGNGMKTVNIEDPKNPILVSSFRSSESMGVYSKNNYTYLADDLHGVYVIDVSNPSNPIQVSSTRTNLATSVFVKGDYAFITGGSGMVIYNVSQPTSIEYKGRYDISFPDRVCASNSYAFIVAGRKGLYVVDITDKTKPVYFSSVLYPNAINVHISGSYFYVVDFEKGVDIYSLNPS